MISRLKKKNIAIVLVEPQIPENIGSVARAMNNMDIERLILVNPKNCDLTRILKVATIHSADIVEKMEVFSDLRSALSPFQYVAGTTARLGVMRPGMMNPRGLGKELISISQDNLVAVIFGPEDRGLSNDHLKYCHTIVTVPTSDFSSLNLAQSVMIICYEIFMAGNDTSTNKIYRLANIFELEGMYEHLKNILMKIGFVNPQNPEHWMLNIRRFFSRLPLRAIEVRIIRGICRQIDWYTDQFEKSKETDN